MRFKNFTFSTGLFDAGNAAPTFSFRLSNFFENAEDLPDEWYVFQDLYQISNVEQLQVQLMRKQGKLLRGFALTAVNEMHRQFFPEENDVELIAELCSDRYAAPSRDDRELWKIGNALDIDHVVKQIRYADGKKEIFATPLKALNYAANGIAKNILRRLHDLEAPLAHLLIQAYLGSAMPLTISAQMVYAYHRTGVAPTSGDLRKQALRHSDFWQPETLQQSLVVIKQSDADPTLTTLSIASEYHRNKAWFKDPDLDAAIQEDLANIDLNVPAGTPEVPREHPGAPDA